RARGTAVLLPAGADPAPTGHTWQAWFLDGGEPRPADTFGTGGGGEVLAGLPAAATAVAVTLEPEGGSDAPTTDPVVTYALPA
ncbi:anti-sigma factor domain-containing protein, partial [Kineococcus glutinatus]|uniref:anti-sigma factor domain-containing protein n=1 Tax=Kineococcus glutinatus TaxID=1070872 RepID=UPI0031E62E75